jgi:hypothetical protein
MGWDGEDDRQQDYWMEVGKSVFKVFSLISLYLFRQFFIKKP